MQRILVRTWEGHDWWHEHKYFACRCQQIKSYFRLQIPRPCQRTLPGKRTGLIMYVNVLSYVIHAFTKECIFDSKRKLRKLGMFSHLPIKWFALVESMNAHYLNHHTVPLPLQVFLWANQLIQLRSSAKQTAVNRHALRISLWQWLR